MKTLESLNYFLVKILEVTVDHLNSGGTIYPDSLAHEELKTVIELCQSKQNNNEVSLL